MVYVIDVDDQDKFSITFVDEPSYIRGLRMAPELCERELLSGDWLLLVFAIWNSNDRQSIDEAVNVVKQYRGRFQLGIRPYELASEMNSWLGTVEASPTLIEISEVQSEGPAQLLLGGVNSATPTWVWLRDGLVKSIRSGAMSHDELRVFIENNLASVDQSDRENTDSD